LTSYLVPFRSHRIRRLLCNFRR